MEVKEIKLSQIQLSESNTRKDLGAGTEDAGIEDLANSIKEKGLLNPIIVSRKEDGNYELIAGQRRFLACQKLGWESIPAIIRDFKDDTDATIISLVENIHRADMNPIDKARAYQKIYEKYKDHNKVNKETGVSVSTVRKYLALLKLAPTIQEKLTTSDGPAGIATLAKIAETFSLEEQEMVLDGIGGFKQQIQLEMIKRSGGDLEKLAELRAQALDGAFNIRTCTGLSECPLIPEEIKKVVEKLEKGDTKSFKNLVKRLKR